MGLIAFDRPVLRGHLDKGESMLAEYFRITGGN